MFIGTQKNYKFFSEYRIINKNTLYFKKFDDLADRISWAIVHKCKK